MLIVDDIKTESRQQNTVVINDSAKNTETHHKYDLYSDYWSDPKGILLQLEDY